MKNKKIIALLLIIAMGLSLYACSKAEGEIENNDPVADETDRPEKHPDSLTIAIESEPTTLNPYDHAAVTSGYMNQMTYNRLFRIDTATLEPVPDLCDTYENVDELTWLFKIKEGVKFHDGTVMTADDVKASMEYARQFTSSNKYTSFWQAIEVVDPLTVRVVTNTPYALILNDLAANGNTILPKHLIDEGNDFNQNPIGSGPYKFVEWTLGDHVTFVKNDEYFDAEHMPSITNVVWRVIPEGSSRTIALETGEVDLVIDVDTTDSRRLMDNEKLGLVEKEGTRMNFMGVNTERAPFNNADFRKAVTAAIDREAVLTVAANGHGTVALSPNPQVYRGSSSENTVSYDVEQAKAYLAASGVSPEDAVFTCITYTDATRRTAEVIQSYLMEIGITMNIESMDFAAYLSNMLDGNFDAVIGGFTSSDLLTYLKSLWHSGSIGASNVPRVNDPEIDALIEQAMTTLDTDRRAALMEQVCAKVNGDCLMISLYTSSVIRAYDSRLQGVDVSAAGGMLYQDLRWAE